MTNDYNILVFAICKVHCTHLGSPRSSNMEPILKLIMIKLYSENGA